MTNKTKPSAIEAEMAEQNKEGISKKEKMVVHIS